MTYYLALDLENNKHTLDRYHLISNAKLNLPQEDNLKAIFNFTTQFTDSSELKEHLIKEKIIPYQYRYYSLVIVYQKRGIFNLKVAYKEDKKLQIYGMLLQTIKEEITQNDQFLAQFLAYFRGMKNLPAEYWQLRSFIDYYQGDQQLFLTLHAFLNKVCYSKGKFNYQKFYELAMYTSSLIPKVEKTKNATNTSSLSETQLFQQEELEARQRKNSDNQIRLF